MAIDTQSPPKKKIEEFYYISAVNRQPENEKAEDLESIQEHLTRTLDHTDAKRQQSLLAEWNAERQEHERIAKFDNEIAKFINERLAFSGLTPEARELYKSVVKDHVVLTLLEQRWSNDDINLATEINNRLQTIIEDRDKVVETLHRTIENLEQASANLQKDLDEAQRDTYLTLHQVRQLEIKNLHLEALNHQLEQENQRLDMNRPQVRSPQARYYRQSESHRFDALIAIGFAVGTLLIIAGALLLISAQVSRLASIGLGAVGVAVIAYSVTRYR